MRSSLTDLGTVRHWGCRRHGTINRADALCPVCVSEAHAGTFRPSVADRVRAIALAFVDHCRDALGAVGDSLGQW